MEKEIDKYIDEKFKYIGLNRDGGWADGLTCKDLENIIRDAILYGIRLTNDSL